MAPLSAELGYAGHHATLGGIAYGAGVEYHGICLFHRVDSVVAVLTQNGGNHLRVGHIHPAAEGLDI